MSRKLTLLFLGLSILTTSWLAGQSTTSSAINGFVTDATGFPLGEIDIEAIHEPTGSTQRTTSRSNGAYTLRGLRPGGPYTVRAQAPGRQPALVSAITLDLQQTRTVNLRLPALGGQDADVFVLEAVEVSAADADAIFSNLNMGANTSIDADYLDSLPTVSRSLTDFIRLDPRLAVLDRDSGAVSAGGQNTRYNSILIDGVPTNDTFGLNDNGLPSRKQPFALDTIDQISVELSPYNVLNSGFTGAAVSAVTKSGTNNLKGSAYFYYRDETLSGDLTDRDGEEVAFKDFYEFTGGITLGGPIIKDKLFYFVAYEKVEESVVQEIGDYVPAAGPWPTANPGTIEFQNLSRITDNPDEIVPYEEQIRLISQELYGFDPGVIAQPEDAKLLDDKYLAKLDYNLTDRHRLSLRLNHTTSTEPFFPSLAADGSTAYDSSWWSRDHTNTDLTFEWFGNWSDELDTEFLVSRKSYVRSRENNSTLPYVSLNNVEGLEGPGTINFGTLGSGQADRLEVDTTVVRLRSSYNIGKHTLSAGINIEQFDNNNLFISNRYGTWRFGSGIPSYLRATSSGNADNYNLALPAEGVSGAAEWSLQQVGLYLQDEWNVTQQLSLVFGLRYDLPLVSESPQIARQSPNINPETGQNYTFEDIFGLSNTGTVDGNAVWQPRVGFNYAIEEDRTTQIRGGLGLFYGSAPHVWLSNAFVNNGNTIIQYFSTGSNTPAFSTDTESPPIPDRTPTRVNVDLVDPAFEMPTFWKGNLAVDRKLPWYGLVLTLEGQWTRSKSDIFYQHLNLQQNFGGFNKGFLPDGRELYTGSFSSREREDGYQDVILLTNTDKGYTENYTLELKRELTPITEGSRFSIGVRSGYTFTRSRTVTDGESASAFNNWRNNIAPNPNDAVLGISSFERQHRLVASITGEMRLGKAHRTRITLFYDGRSGRPYSYMYGLSEFTNNAKDDLNGDGIANDLIYVPTGIDDPLVSWGSRNLDQEGAQRFMDFVNSEPGLSKYKGQIVPRNTGRAPWVNQFDLNIEHTVTFADRHRVTFSLAVQNIGNLINSEWGLERVPKSENGGVARIVEASRGPRVDPITGKGNEFGFYTYNVAADFDSDAALYETRRDSNRWQMLLGLKYAF